MYQYSLANVDLNLEIDFPGYTGERHFKVQGFPTGENLITVARKAPIATTTPSAYGDMTVNMQRIKIADLVFPVLHNAPENAYLQQFANYFQEQADADGVLIKPIQGKVVDNMGRDSALLTNGVILAIPAMARGQQVSTVTWIITFEKAIIYRKNGGDDYENLGV